MKYITMENHEKILLYASFIVICIFQNVSCDLRIEPKTLEIQTGNCSTFNLFLSDSSPTNATITITTESEHITKPRVTVINVKPSVAPQRWTVETCGYEAGRSIVYAKIYPPFTSDAPAFLHVEVYKLSYLNIVSFISGWIYFAAWTISFYPQVIENFRRKSVVGLNFDFIALNIVGFFLYSTFNCALYWVPDIQEQYYLKYPQGMNPVQLNDVGFSIHAFFVCVFTAFQCFIYERGGQTVSCIALCILGVYCVILLVAGVFVFIHTITVLSFLYICSYIKLSITTIKYIPQAIMNYRRRSTDGWSIGNVLLDFTGGFLSIIQMIITSYNYNDWESFFGDFTKFGLGLFSISFDIIFMFQHYILYRNQPTSTRQLEKPNPN